MQSSGSVPLHFVEHGEGVPVLSIHGWPPDHRIMAGCLEPVFASRTGWRRLYPDLPGMGRTPAPESVTSSDDLLDTLQDFIDDHIGEEPFVLVGESYGGYLARAVANTRRQQVIGLCLICPMATDFDPDRRTLPERTVIASDPHLMAGLEPAEAEIFGSIAVVQSLETLNRFRTEVAAGLAIADQPALERIHQRWKLSTPPESGTPYHHPGLIITGRQDDSVGYADTFGLLNHYPRATFAVLDRAGHNTQIEQPVLFGALVGEWLDRVMEAMRA